MLQAIHSHPYPPIAIHSHPFESSCATGCFGLIPKFFRTWSTSIDEHSEATGSYPGKLWTEGHWGLHISLSWTQSRRNLHEGNGTSLSLWHGLGGIAGVGPAVWCSVLVAPRNQPASGSQDHLSKRLPSGAWFNMRTVCIMIYVRWKLTALSYFGHSLYADGMCPPRTPASPLAPALWAHLPPCGTGGHAWSLGLTKDPRFLWQKITWLKHPDIRKIPRCKKMLALFWSSVECTKLKRKALRPPAGPRKPLWP